MAHQDHKMVAVEVLVFPVAGAVAAILTLAPLEDQAREVAAVRVVERIDN